MATSPHAAYDAARQKRKVQMKKDEMRIEGGLNKSEITIEETGSHSKIHTQDRDK